MPNQRACIPCKYPAAQDYIDRRLSEGADLTSLVTELRSAYRMKVIGYERGPSLAMLRTHQRDHRGTAPVSGNLPTFDGSMTPSSGETVAGDVATAIQKQALELLEKGEMRLTAHHALKAQEILDRRAERAADRELTLVLARLMTSGKPPAALIEAETAIEGEYTELGTADD